MKWASVFVMHAGPSWLEVVKMIRWLAQLSVLFYQHRPLWWLWVLCLVHFIHIVIQCFALFFTWVHRIESSAPLLLICISWDQMPVELSLYSCSFSEDSLTMITEVFNWFIVFMWLSLNIMINTCTVAQIRRIYWIIWPDLYFRCQQTRATPPAH